MASNRLSQYRAKRDFGRTQEPAGNDPAGPGNQPAGEEEAGIGDAVRGASDPRGPRFVVQQHHATRLHWDLRLEHDGVLASWALPNGIPPDPAANRLAVRTEDHPLEYLEFQGEIPRGQYGAGTMTIWDRGRFDVHKWEERKVEVTFHGERLRGRHGLFPIGRDDDARQDWMIHRMDPPEDPARVPMPERVLPMLARSGRLPPDPERWAFEVKWDGVRAIAYVQPGRLRLESRNLNDITAAYPEVRGLLEQTGMREMVLDGEIVTFDAEGRPSFERLQRRMHVSSPSAVRRLMGSIPVVYAIFDLLYLDGRWLAELPYADRRARLESLELDGRAWRVAASHRGEGARLLEATGEQGIEGIVAKRLDCRYEPGRRSGAWLKIKHTHRQEFVIGGWLPGEGRRARRIGALLVGYHEDGALVYAGRVGTGFTEATLEELAARLAPLRRRSSPFERAPRLPREAVFVEPQLVAEVEFRDWTEDGVLRAPSFKGLREDKPAPSIVREGRPSRSTARRARGAQAAARQPGAEPQPAAQPQPAAEPQPATQPQPSSPEALFDSVERLPDGALAVTLDGRRLRISNWEKVLFPRAGFTKGDLIAYYARIAPAVLPHLRDRALTLKRYPDGVEGEHFYEKQSPGHRPEWVQTARVGDIVYTLVQDRPTLVWLANLADIELHTSLAHAHAPARPTMLVFDLDPGPGVGLVACCEVGAVLHGLFAQLGLESFAKTSGSKGLQVYVPLNAAADFVQTKALARRIAELLEQRMPELVVSRMTRRLRAGKVLVDWSQNDEHKTTVAVYSVRARERPTVSTPVSWEEVERCRRERDERLLTFEVDEVLRRVEERGDLFAPLLTLRQELPGT